MAKQNYIDKNILRTPVNLYNSALDVLEGVEARKKQEGDTPVIVKGYHAVASTLREAILFGEEDAAYPLAYLYSNGLGVSKSLEKTILWLMIGKNLGHQVSADLLKGIDNTNIFDMTHLLSNILKMNHQALELKALKYSKVIESNKIHYNFTNGLSDEDIGMAAMKFEKADGDHLIEIFEENIISNQEVLDHSSAKTAELRHLWEKKVEPIADEYLSDLKAREKTLAGDDSDFCGHCTIL